jgi:hypothetical protein
MTASPGPAAGYGDTLALTDIHALRSSPARPGPDDAPRDVATVLVRASRPPWPSRIITAAAGDDARGMPVARVDADRAQVFVSPNGPGPLVQLSPLGQAGAEAPEMTAAGTLLRQPEPPRGRS